MDHEFAHTDVALKGLEEYAHSLMDEEGLTHEDAMRIAAATMDGAGDHEGKTVESIQTCRDLFGDPVKGLTTDDIPNRRQDPYAKSEAARHNAADKNMDVATMWLKLSSISGGRDVANKIAELVAKNPKELRRFWHLIKVCVHKNFSDQEIIDVLNESVRGAN